MSIQSNHHPETLEGLDAYAIYAKSFDHTEYSEEPKDEDQLEGCSLRDLSEATRALIASGYSLSTILSLVSIAAGEPPLPRLPNLPTAPPPF